MPVIERIEEFSKQPLLIADYRSQQCKRLALTVSKPTELSEACQKIICGLSAFTIGRTLRQFLCLSTIESILPFSL